MAKNKKKLKVIPLGGLQEIGKNITVFEYGDEIIVVDCGLAFPEDEMLGIDLVIPDTTYLAKNKDKVKAIVLTHGHEDHIGALPYVLKDINVPVYGTKLTLGLLQYKLEEHGMLSSVSLNTVKQGQTIDLGVFKVEFIRSTHSIADTVALAIYTPVGIVVHTADFKIDYTPIEGEPMDLARFAELGKKGVLLLMCDSTNVEREGYTMSEKTVGEAFEDIFMNAGGRILIATFASNVHRVQQAINSAVKFNRKVAICGRSMVNVVKAAMDLGYMHAPEGVMVDIDTIHKYNPENLVLITTGSQGEPMSALTRIAASEHKKVEIAPGDLVIISANPIPGNEKLVSRVINELFRKGAEVIYEALADIHVSGHACQEELKLIHSIVKPKFFFPVHGEHRHLKQHANLAHKLGMPNERIFVMEIGKVLELTSDTAKISGSVPAGKVLVDGLGVGDVGNIVLRDRKHLSQDGLIVVVITIEGDTGNVAAGPDIISRGFVYVRESEDLMENMREVVKKALDKCEDKRKNDWGARKNAIKDSLRDFIYEKTKRKPMILPIIMEV
ncbi:ribonuclease J [Anaerobacterium chartisolvens]|uniref:Ribonuclease J n=1 Tax=Anaerobacterium chartisolvens TaxID=1297424 RepID=A0A369BKC1_9FIRM|nr:ribonuclease J [Anaerobacterium chartisolvens]RCX20144.1 ribonuclease J [Anaerobacterium chartisolvens]